MIQDPPSDYLTSVLIDTGKVRESKTNDLKARPGSKRSNNLDWIVFDQNGNVYHYVWCRLTLIFVYFTKMHLIIVLVCGPVIKVGKCPIIILNDILVISMTFYITAMQFLQVLSTKCSFFLVNYYN